MRAQFCGTLSNTFLTFSKLNLNSRMDCTLIQILVINFRRDTKSLERTIQLETWIQPLTLNWLWTALTSFVVTVHGEQTPVFEDSPENLTNLIYSTLLNLQFVFIFANVFNTVVTIPNCWKPVKIRPISKKRFLKCTRDSQLNWTHSRSGFWTLVFWDSLTRLHSLLANPRCPHFTLQA